MSCKIVSKSSPNDSHMLSYVKEEQSFMPFDQKSYINSYNKNTYKTILFRVRKDNEKVMNKINSLRNINKYLLQLIDDDIEPNILTIKQIKDRIRPVMEKHGIRDVYLFGSYARGEATNKSDVDIYCEPGDVQTLIDEVTVEEELAAALGKDVDVLFFGTTFSTDFFKEQLDADKIKIC